MKIQLSCTVNSAQIFKHALINVAIIELFCNSVMSEFLSLHFHIIIFLVHIKLGEANDHH